MLYSQGATVDCHRAGGKGVGLPKVTGSGEREAQKTCLRPPAMPIRQSESAVRGETASQSSATCLPRQAGSAGKGEAASQSSATRDPAATGAPRLGAARWHTCLGPPTRAMTTAATDSAVRERRAAGGKQPKREDAGERRTPSSTCALLHKEVLRPATVRLQLAGAVLDNAIKKYRHSRSASAIRSAALAVSVTSAAPSLHTVVVSRAPGQALGGRQPQKRPPERSHEHEKK